MSNDCILYNCFTKYKNQKTKKPRNPKTEKNETKKFIKPEILTKEKLIYLDIQK